MRISRRDFLKCFAAVSASVGLGPADLIGLEEAAARTDAPSVLWLQGSGCSGCTISFLDYVSPSEPVDAADVLIQSVNLVYHPTLSAGAGDTAVTAINDAKGFILVVEGGVPSAFEGHACVPWSDGGSEVPFHQAVRNLSQRASQVVCVGTCAAFGGISAMGDNPAGVQGVREAIQRDTINISGCPPHPDWIVGTLGQMLLGRTVAVDREGRPSAIYRDRRMCDQCPFHRRGEARSLGVRGQCMEAMGCRGEESSAPCPATKWNNGVNWCIAAGSPCLGCTEPAFPNTTLFRQRGRGGGGRGRGGRGWGRNRG